MTQSFAIWFLIALALVTANLPFFLRRPMLALPWAQGSAAARPAWRSALEAIVFFAVFAAVVYGSYAALAGAFFVASDAGSVAWFVLKVLAVMVVAAGLLAYPGWRDRGQRATKPFFSCLLEVLAFYILVGAMGFGFEANMGNLFPKTWEFYAVTLSLFLVLGYPGFVLRFLMRRRKAGRTATVAKDI
jgi:hypothetical protein